MNGYGEETGNSGELRMCPQIKESGWSKPWQEWESGVDMEGTLLDVTGAQGRAAAASPPLL